MKMPRVLYIVLDPHGVLCAPRGIAASVERREANRLMIEAAERDEELACGDINRWELNDMPFKEAQRRGYRVRKVFVFE